MAGSERAVGPHRSRLDSAATVGAPAQVTVLYPFVPPEELGVADHARLEELFAAHYPVWFLGRRTERFGDRVLFVALEDVELVRELTTLPVDQLVDHVELWSGPAATGRATRHRS